MAKMPSNIGVGVEGCTSLFHALREGKLMNHFVVVFIFGANRGSRRPCDLGTPRRDRVLARSIAA
jgi:hypothetical protein